MLRVAQTRAPHEQEHAAGASSSVGQENVALGQLLHTTSYPEARHKDVLIDGLIRLDFTEGGVVHEVKKTRGGLAATRMQILYYLWYLKHEKGIETTGVIDFPTERRRETVTLTPEAEEKVVDLLIEARRIKQLPTPPVVEEPMRICRQCSYQDLCWG